MFLFGKRKNSVPDEALGRIEKEAKELRIENAVSMETLRRIEEKTQRLGTKRRTGSAPFSRVCLSGAILADEAFF